MKTNLNCRWGIALLGCGLALLFAAVCLGFVQPRFQAAARIRIQRLDPRTPSNSYFPEQTPVEASDVLLSNVIADLDLRQKWGDRFANGTVLEEREAATMLRRRLELNRVRNSVLDTPTAITEIRVTDELPDEAARIANAIAESIQREYLARNGETVSNAATSIESNWERQWKEREEKIRQARSNLNALRFEMRISEYEDPPPDSDPDKLRSFNQCSRELTRLQAEMRNFKTNVVAPEIVNKVAMTLAEISDTAEPPRQPVWPNVILRRSLFSAAAVFALAGAALLIIPPWLSGRRTKKR